MLFRFLACFVLAFCRLCVAENTPEQVLNFWFSDLQSPNDYPQDKSKIWFRGGESVDAEIRSHFESLLLSAEKGDLAEWKNNPRGRLALIILSDQFSRNMYRGTPRAFAFDFFSLSLVLEGLEKGEDLALYPIERAFFYLPLEHAEDLSLQDLSLKKYTELALEAPEALKQILASNLKYAQAHYDIIERFGRFPHRNAILGRESTPEELEFLKEPGSSF